jgi:hypothetical protein
LAGGADNNSGYEMIMIVVLPVFISLPEIVPHP